MLPVRNLLFYAPVSNQSSFLIRLQSLIEALGVENKTETYQNIKTLGCRLRKPECRPHVAVLLAPDHSDLTDILSVQPLLEDVRIILILPDREQTTITKGHLLRPRFLTYFDGNFGDIAAVLTKMLSVSPTERKLSYVAS